MRIPQHHNRLLSRPGQRPEPKHLLPDEIVMRYYGCGSPIPDKIDGCTVLDLGCGTGRDVYVVSKLVGAGVANTVGFRRE